MNWLCFTVVIFGSFLHVEAANNPPTFDETFITALGKNGVSEDTPVGTTIGKFTCIDADSDPILYGTQSGSAFEVKSDGSLVLLVELDFENKETVGSTTIEFSCLDFHDGTPGEPVTRRIEIVINDANDNPPQFKAAGKGFNFEVSENVTQGEEILPRISITDADTGNNAYLNRVYLVCEESANETEESRAMCEDFKVTFLQRQEEGLGIQGEYVATFSVKKPLDYETRASYSSKLIAVDGFPGGKQLSSTVNILIQLLDEQDMPPFFINPGTSTTVSEGAPQGYQLDFSVQAQDGDQGAGRRIEFTIIEDERNAFTLLPSTPSATSKNVFESKVIIKTPLDREQILGGAYQYVVKATELDDNNQTTTATATATFSVFIEDVNDNPPAFDKSVYEVDVTEMPSQRSNQTQETTIQVSGLSILCNDPDEPANAKYEVLITRQTFPNEYSISPDTTFTGQATIFLKVEDIKYLDYDQPQYRSQEVWLEARELSPSPDGQIRSSTAVVNLNLVDINDNKPEFTSSAYTVKVSENRQPPADIITVTATDRDSGENGRIQYRIASGPPDIFSVNSQTGVITMNKKLDYEDTSEYVLWVQATDQAVGDQQSGQTQVLIEVENYNDLPPQFLQDSYVTSVLESSTEFISPVQVRAIDSEDGSAAITYQITDYDGLPPNTFRLDPDTGVLTLLRNLNFKDTGGTGKFTIEITASDNGVPELTSSTNVVISVLNENDHAPRMVQSIFNVKLSEMAPGGLFVAQVKATDDDEGTFGEITFRLGSGGFDNFLVNPSTGNVTVSSNQNFDYDSRSNYRVLIIATDGGAPQKSATATIDVVIEDENNKSPSFKESIYTRNVEETRSVGSVILTVFATDPDTSADLRYSIDYGAMIATDQNGNPLRDTSRYNYRAALRMNERTGDLIINNTLDKDYAVELSFPVVVTDINAHPAVTPQTASAQVTITVTGEPNRDITFRPVYSISINENIPVDSKIMTLTATDPVDDSAISTYQKVEGFDSGDYFSVARATGVIRVKRKLDFESDLRMHVLAVRGVARDGVRSATVSFTINILDSNDNAPQFQLPRYQAEVLESMEYPHEVINMLATDRDTSSFGPVEYIISSGLDAEDFKLIPTQSGRVLVVVAPGRKLDYNRRPEYDLDITASDNPNSDSIRQTTTVKLKIKVIDENDKIPTFSEDRREMSVAETADINFSVGSVFATDEDQGENGRVTYTVKAVDSRPESVEALQLFRVNSVTGTIYVNANLRGQGNNDFSMLVIATDHGSPPNQGSILVVISVLGTEDNDGTPKWFYPPADAIVDALEEEDNYILDLPINVKARTPQATVLFSLSDIGKDAKNFRIDSRTGNITIIKKLDREIQQDYKLLIYAQDSINTTLISGRTIIVRLTDKNDNDPSFENFGGLYPACPLTLDRPLIVYVNENTPSSTVIYNLRACDPDSPEFNQAVYEAYTSNPYCERKMRNNGLIVRQNGDIETARRIDYEQTRDFVMCVQAKPVLKAQVRRRRAVDTSQMPNRTDVAVLDIRVIDQNDNGPTFLRRRQVAMVHSSPYSKIVLQLDAVDPDGDAYSGILYRISDTGIVFYPRSGHAKPENGAFLVDAERGQITVTYPSYSRYVGGHFEMKVIARDKIDSSKTDEQDVWIYVYEKGQAMKVVLKMEPRKGREVSDELINYLNGADDRISFIFLQVSEHQTQNSKDDSKTDICFMAVDESSKSIMTISDVLDLLNSAKYKEILQNDTYNYIDSGQCHPMKSSEDSVKWKDLWWVLVAVAIFIFVCCLILIIFVLILHDRYKTYMKTRKTYLVQQ